MTLKKIVVVIMFIIGGCLLNAQVDVEQGMLLSQRFYRSPEEIEIYINKAKNDDGDACFELGHYYLWFEGDVISAYYWYDKGIQVGHIGCMYEFGLMFMNTNIEARYTVALKYFNLILQEATNGNEYAIELIGRIPNEDIEDAKNFDSISGVQKKEAEEYLEKILEKARKMVEEDMTK